MKIKDLVKKFKNLNVLIIGDIFLDKYIIGDVHRISPEAPIPIVVYNKTNRR
jgi:D-glycero-beta-D-manno-heptose-7-phosphate kinase